MCVYWLVGCGSGEPLEGGRCHIHAHVHSILKFPIQFLLMLYSLRSVCWLVGCGSGEPVEGGVVQQKSGNTGDIFATQSGWSLYMYVHVGQMIVT